MVNWEFVIALSTLFQQMHDLCIYCLAFKPVTSFCISKKQESLSKVIRSNINQINYKYPLSLSPNPTQSNIRFVLCQNCREEVNYRIETINNVIYFLVWTSAWSATITRLFGREFLFKRLVMYGYDIDRQVSKQWWINVVSLIVVCRCRKWRCRSVTCTSHAGTVSEPRTPTAAGAHWRTSE